MWEYAGVWCPAGRIRGSGLTRKNGLRRSTVGRVAIQSERDLLVFSLSPFTPGTARLPSDGVVWSLLPQS